MKTNHRKTPAILSAALLSSLGIGASHAADTSSSALFSAVDLDRGYMVSIAEGKCGEGKCGAEKKDEEEKDAEGKCGEGKCGATDKEGEKKDPEGKCGEGKCGGAA